MTKNFEQESAEGYFEFNPDRSFEERCEVARCTSISPKMSYEERLRMLKCRFGI